MKVSLSRPHGLTLIELCVVIALVLVLLGLAAPSFGEAAQRQRLLGLATQFQADVGYVRATAVARNEALRVTFLRSDSGTGYVIHSGDASQCAFNTSGEARCNAPARLLKAEFVRSAELVTLRANVGSMLFDPLHGTVTPSTTLNLVGANGQTVRAIVNLMGRARSCAATSPFPGLGAC